MFIGLLVVFTGHTESPDCKKFNIKEEVPSC